MATGIAVETQIKLNRFKPRSYQVPILDALENKGYKKILVVMGRRAGKDIVSFNAMIRMALRRVGIYYYLLPTATQARKVMFDGITMDSMKIIDFIPSELVKGINIQQMKITLINNSIIQFCGSENYDSLRGTNAVGIVFSEYAYQHPMAYPTLRPILLANDGWAIFISTPFGSNHFHTLYEIAKSNPHEWFVYYAPVSVTQHISEEQIQAEIDTGEISPDMARQEYYCDFSTGAVGSYYASYLNKMELEGRITQVDWEPNFPVHSAWDLGVRDETVIIMFQVIGKAVHILDVYSNSSVGLEHYINVLQTKPYTWGRHIAPHDIQVREFTAGGLSRFEKAMQLGFKFTVAPNLSLMDGIECVRTTLPRIYIDEKKCRPLIAALRNYRKEYDSARKVYKPTPLHDHNSHYCDALRYLAVSLSKLRVGATPEDIDRRYREAVLGADAHLPPVYRNDLPHY